MLKTSQDKSINIWLKPGKSPQREKTLNQSFLLSNIKCSAERECPIEYPDESQSQCDLTFAKYPNQCPTVQLDEGLQFYNVNNNQLALTSQQSNLSFWSSVNSPSIRPQLLVKQKSKQPQIFAIKGERMHQSTAVRSVVKACGQCRSNKFNYIGFCAR